VTIRTFYRVARYEQGATPEQVHGKLIKSYGDRWRDKRAAETKAREVLDLHPGDVTSVEPVVGAE
jgi:hypothetical protein